MVYIHFIINPISGDGKHIITESYLRDQFPRSEFRIEVDYTKHKRHAIELATKAVALNADCVVACGGEGTINEVASCLIGTTAKLGIIPVGSGNGLASNLQIPQDISKAIQIIKSGKMSFIDAGKLNDNYFFSNTGFGIDALIIKKYEQSGKRKLSAYIKAALSSSLQFKPTNAILSFNDRIINVHPFLLFVSNSNEMGYHMSLTPKASLSDGYLDLMVVPRLSFIKKLVLGYYVLRNRIDKFKNAQHFLIQKLTIVLPDKIFTDAQIDGEGHYLKTNIFEISVIARALEVYTK